MEKLGFMCPKCHSGRINRKDGKLTCLACGTVLQTNSGSEDMIEKAASAINHDKDKQQ